jgi:very-short-patch-repair endonuclease
LVYKDANTKVTIKCKIHGPFVQWPSDHRRGFGCPTCSGKARNTTEKFIIRANQIHNNFYDYSKTVYISSTKPITVECPNHGAFTIPKAGWHIHGTSIGCSTCCRSKGEIAIKKWLELNNIKFEEQKRFDGFKTKSFDFYLNEFNMCIEFDGAQHFYAKNQPTKDKDKALKSFNDIQTRDRAKNEFCKANNIHLLRINYKQIKQLETILTNEILRNTAK